MKVLGIFTNSLRVCGDLVVNTIKKINNTIFVKNKVTGNGVPKINNISDWSIGSTNESFYISNGTPIKTYPFRVGSSGSADGIIKIGAHSHDVTISMSGPSQVLLNGRNVYKKLTYNVNVASKAQLESINPPAQVCYVVINITGWTQGEKLQYLGYAQENRGVTYFLINQTQLGIEIQPYQGRDQQSNEKIAIAAGPAGDYLPPSWCVKYVVPSYRYTAIQQS